MHRAPFVRIAFSNHFHLRVCQSSRSAYNTRDYHGDPGPSTSLHLKTARRQVRDAVKQGKGVVRGREELEKMMASSRRVSEGSGNSGTTLTKRNLFRPTEIIYRPAKTFDHKLPHPNFQRRPDNNSPSWSSLQDGEGPRLRRPSFARHGASHAGVQLADDPWTSSNRIKKWIESRSGSLQENEIDDLYTTVATASKSQVNAVSWNMLLALLGKEAKLDRMWRAFNEMKKRGITPNIMTFSAMLNAYADATRLSTSTDNSVQIRKPESRTLSRVTNIFEQSKTYTQRCLSEARSTSPLASSPTGASKGIGLVTASSLAKINDSFIVDQTTANNTKDISPVAINAYLKFLARYGMIEEMQRVFLTMDKIGPLAPDAITYTLMFSGLLNLHGHISKSKENQIADTANGGFPVTIGPTARLLWDQAVRQFRPVVQNTEPSKQYEQKSGGAEGSSKRTIDEGLAVTALQTLMLGRPQDKRLAAEIIPRLWGLSIPGRSSSPSSISTVNSSLQNSLDLPLLPLTISAATAIMNILRNGEQHTLASHLTQVFLDTPTLQPHFDFPFLKTAITNLSITAEITSILSIFDSYQPQSESRQWPADVYISALRAARWAADFKAAMIIFRRLTHLPINVEAGQSKIRIGDLGSNTYRWESPNGQETDLQGNIWIPTKPIKPYATIMTMFLKTALNCGMNETRQAMNVFNHYRLEHFFSLPEQNLSLLPPFKRMVTMDRGAVRSVQARLSLAKEVELACERLLGNDTGRVEGNYVKELKNAVKSVQDFWGPVLGKSEKGTPRSDGLNH